MNMSDFERILGVGEHIGVEFKAAQGGPKDDTYETVCAFLNRFGGDIFLGVSDDGKVVGVPDGAVDGMIRNVIKTVNNPEILSPACNVYSEAFSYDGKMVIRIHVPESSDVHRYKGTCYDRNFEADVKIRSTDEITDMCIRKRNIFSERKLFPYVEKADLKMELLPKVRNLIHSRNHEDPWLNLDDDQLLSVSGLYEKDFITGKKSFNGAAVLLLGRDDVIFSCFPSYKTDALLRRINKERYDDREIVDCNLIEAYEKLVAFGIKHLPDKFHLEGTQSVSLRNAILREVIGNTLIHREFSSPRTARMIIDDDCLKIDNTGKASKCGPITLENLTPVSKNPVISRFFRQIDRADELGSGTINLFHFVRLYSNAEPILMEGDTFVATIPLNPNYSRDKEDRNKIDRLAEMQDIIINDCPTTSRVLGEIRQNPGRRTNEIASKLSMGTATISRHLKALKESGMIIFRGAPKNGGYFAV